MKELTQLQDELLHTASLLVKPGGILVYSTCSLEAVENEERVFTFLKTHPQFVVENIGEVVQGFPSECVTKGGFMQLLPHVHGGDGAFAAKLKRRED